MAARCSESQKSHSRLTHVAHCVPLSTSFWQWTCVDRSCVFSTFCMTWPWDLLACFPGLVWLDRPSCGQKTICTEQRTNGQSVHFSNISHGLLWDQHQMAHKWTKLGNSVLSAFCMTLQLAGFHRVDNQKCHQCFDRVDDKGGADFHACCKQKDVA